MRVHPDPGVRRRALDETERLLRLGFWDAFGTGCAAGIGLLNVKALLNLLVTTSTIILAPLAAALLVATLTVGVVGVGVWRTTFVALARAEPPRGAGRLGLGLGLGLIVGQKLSFADDPSGPFWRHFPQPIDPLPTPVEYHVALEVAWGSLLLASMFFFLRWIAAGASTWLEVSAADPSPRPTYRLGLTVAGGLLVVWLGALYAFYFGSLALIQLGAGPAQPISDPIQAAAPGADLPAEVMRMAAVVITVGLLTGLLMLVSLWALPLAPWLWRRRVAAATGSSWAFLDHPSESLRLPPQPPLRPDLALRAGLVGGVSYYAVSSLTLGVLHLAAIAGGFTAPAAGHEVSGGTGGDDLEVLVPRLIELWALAGQLALAVLLPIIVAAIVAARVPRLAGLHGLFAAFVAACVTAPGTIGTLFVFGSQPLSGWWENWLFVNTFITCVPLLALPIATGASVLAGRKRGRAARGPRPEPGPRQGGPIDERSLVRG